MVDELYDIVKLPDNVFEAAKVETIIFALRKGIKTEEMTTTIYAKDDIVSEISNERSKVVNKSAWKEQENCPFIYMLAMTFREFFKR